MKKLITVLMIPYLSKKCKTHYCWLCTKFYRYFCATLPNASFWHSKIRLTKEKIRDIIGLSHKLNIGTKVFSWILLFLYVCFMNYSKSADSTKQAYEIQFVPISLCDNNRSLHFSVCTTSVVHTFLIIEGIVLLNSA